MAVFGASVFCHSEPKCFRLKSKNNKRQSKQQKSVQISVFQGEDEIHSEEIDLNDKKEGRKGRNDKKEERKNRRKRICPRLPEQVKLKKALLKVKFCREKQCSYH